MDQLYSHYRKWRNRGLVEKDGVIVGSDLTQEWLLPWWWEHFHKTNSFPVTFVDFGMSYSAREWCKERGELVRLLVADLFVVSKEELPLETIHRWEGIYGKKFWPSRHAWFVKPMVFLQSPYRRSVWIDLDCQVNGSVQPLFNFCDHPSGISMTQEPYDPVANTITYTTGVTVFRRGIPLIEEWADGAFSRNREFPGDQDLLSAIILEKKLEIQILPDLYNWSRTFPENRKALILHYHGEVGKRLISHQMSFSL